jgi:cytochrome c-type biogenesis protein CcmH/NrfG
VQAQPDSAEALYFLGRTYMAEQRPADAAKAFERAVSLAGRQPELLGQWAQALYFAADKQWSPQLQALTDEALEGRPEVTSLGLRGIAAFEGSVTRKPSTSGSACWRSCPRAMPRVPRCRAASTAPQTSSRLAAARSSKAHV